MFWYVRFLFIFSHILERLSSPPHIWRSTAAHITAHMAEHRHAAVLRCANSGEECSDQNVAHMLIMIYRIYIDIYWGHLVNGGIWRTEWKVELASSPSRRLLKMVKWLYFVLHVPSQDLIFQIIGKPNIGTESEFIVGLSTVQLLICQQRWTYTNIHYGWKLLCRAHEVQERRLRYFSLRRNGLYGQSCFIQGSSGEWPRHFSGIWHFLLDDHI